MLTLIRHKVKERPTLKGMIRVRLLPNGITEEDFMEWWPRANARERERYTVMVAFNDITSNGKQNYLNYLGSAVLATGTSGFGAVVPFAQYFAVGTGAIGKVNPGDTSVAGELFRAVPSLATVSGYTVEISTLFGSLQAIGTYTNCGIFGNNATGTSGSGMLMTHALYPYVKASGQTVTNDYTISTQ